jgi:DNA-binding MarR family transcriptional regulator
MTAPFVHGYLGYLLGQANHALYKGFDAQVRQAGLSSIEWRVLATLYDAAPLTVNDLTAQVLSKQPTVTKLVQRMAQTGYLVLLADAADHRRTLVAITPTGKKLVRPLVLAAQKHEAQVLRALGAEDVDALKQSLARLAAL